MSPLSPVPFLAAGDKKLFVQLQDVSFDVKIVNVPPYLTRDPEYHGGADKQSSIEDDDEAKWGNSEHRNPQDRAAGDRGGAGAVRGRGAEGRLRLLVHAGAVLFG